MDLQTAWLIGEVGVLQARLGDSNLTTKRNSNTLNENERLTISNTLLLLENSQLRSKLLQTFKRSSVERVAKVGSSEWEPVQDLDPDLVTTSVDMDLELTIVDDEFIPDLCQADLALAWYQAEAMIRANTESSALNDVKVVLPESVLEDYLSPDLEARLINVIGIIETVKPLPDPVTNLDHLNSKLESLVDRLESPELKVLTQPLEDRLVNVIQRLENLPDLNSVDNLVVKQKLVQDGYTQTEDPKSCSVEVIKPKLNEDYKPTTIVLQPYIPEKYSRQVIVLETVSEPSGQVVPENDLHEPKDIQIEPVTFLYKDKIKLNVTKIDHQARQILFNNVKKSAPFDLESACVSVITSLLNWALNGGKEREALMVRYENEEYFVETAELEDERENLNLLKEMQEVFSEFI